MSLDVYLKREGTRVVNSGSGIFVRENGQAVEISRAQWDEKHPGLEPMTFLAEGDPTCVFSANITHNLGAMAGEAGIYHCLWRPDEIGITEASELIKPLADALRVMRENPARFEAYNPSSGWGSYEDFLPWIERYLIACKEYPDATVLVSR